MVPEKGERVGGPFVSELVLNGPLVLAVVVAALPLPPAERSPRQRRGEWALAVLLFPCMC
jgi:hypothetical protein